MTGFADLLEMQEDRGVQATMVALERLGAISFDSSRDALAVRGQYIGREQFQREISRALGRA